MEGNLKGVYYAHRECTNCGMTWAGRTSTSWPTAGELTTILTAKDVARRDAPTCLLTDRIGDVATRVRSSEHNQCIDC